MLFNSFDYALFLPLVLAIYWGLTSKSLKAQNLMLLGASYMFYGAWDPRFLLLLGFSTYLDYFTGLRIHKAKSQNTRRKWLYASVIINLGFLGTFKYYNFFASSMGELLAHMGLPCEPSLLEVALPVGISFYTFHGLSYVFDIYRGRSEPRTNFVNYALFVSFFPLLVAGPIERATHLLPQLERPRRFDAQMAVDGLRQILWGLFKKIVIADNCAVHANAIFDQHDKFSGVTLLLGAFFFAIQIYGDFSGYSDIALGSARLMGSELLKNFAYPYFSRDIAEFWRRWHISLSSWFRDYLYVPLGGSRSGRWSSLRNTFIIFIVSGFWHGANWTFIAWGALNAIYFTPLLLRGRNRRHLDTVAEGRSLPTWRELTQMSGTFFLTLIAWVFFRAASLEHAFAYLGSMLRGLVTPGSYRPAAGYALSGNVPLLFAMIGLLVLVEWSGRVQDHALAGLGTRWRGPFRWGLYYLIMALLLTMAGQEQQFIYFQF